MKRLDQRNAIEFVPLSSQSPAPQLQAPSGCPVSKSELLARFHAQEAGGELLSGAPAFAAMWKRMPHKQLRWIGRTAESSGLFMRALEMSYRGFLIVRPSLQRLVKRMQS